MNKITEIFQAIDSFVWGPPLLILLVGTGIYLTLRLKCLQVTKLPLALKYVFSKDEEEHDDNAVGDVSSYGALCTALSATIGTGNIVGVATAIKAGGPGAMFWMWMAAFFGMATKYAEGLLALKYRTVDDQGQMAGGPMYYIERGLGLKWLAKAFAFFGVGVALLGIGTFAQVNSIADAASLAFNSPKWLTAIIVTALTAAVILGGIKRISSVSEKIVPFMALFYIVGVVILIAFNINKLPYAISLMVRSAFNPQAVLGGTLGITITLAIQRGVARGVFSNESGLGSAPIAAAAAKTKSCVRQGLITMTGTFFDTIVICTMTGLAIVITDTWRGSSEGVKLTLDAFQSGIGVNFIGSFIVNVGLIFFSFTTVLGWNYYGEKCLQYLAGTKAILPYRILYIILVAVGPFLPLELVFIIADIVNGLMAIPNLIGLIGLRKDIIQETEAYFSDNKQDVQASVVS